jgi:hypothetical protein
MAGTYNVTTSATDLANIWRKVQAGIVVSFQFGIEEWNWLKKLKNFKVDWSAREITLELDVNDDVGTASIPEGGYEAIPSSPTSVTATLTWILLNKRFTISKTAQYITEQQGTRGQLESQLRWQSKKAIDGIRRKVGDMFYGLSTGTQALVSSASGDSLVLKDMYAQTGLGLSTANRKVTSLFRVNDYIVALNPSGPALRSATAANNFQKITGIVDSTVTITCGASAMTGVTTGDLVGFANNLEQATIAGGTERNACFVGLIDGVVTASVHSVSNATYPRWAPAVNNSSGGRFTTVKYQNLKDQIYNQGGGELDMVIWSNGVKRDVVSQLTAGLRFTHAFALELDGKAQAKGVQFLTSRRVPDGYVFGLASDNSVNKMALLPDPGRQSFDDGYKLQDNSGLVFSVDFPASMIWTNRANVGMYSGLTEQ